VETLDLLRPSLRAVCVGINPAPKSVAAGHYYQRLFGKFAGCGRLAQFKLGSAPVFVMPRRLRDATKSPSS